MSAQLALLPELLGAHLRLTLLALLVGTALAVPLGVLVSRSPRLEGLVLGAAGILQTIPALALLAVMVPLLSGLGLPGIGIGQDPIEYFNVTWHTNLDTYERIIESDVKSSAVIFAAAVYTLAMRDELLPRFKATEMPALPNGN